LRVAEPLGNTLSLHFHQGILAVENRVGVAHAEEMLIVPDENSVTTVDIFKISGDVSVFTVDFAEARHDEKTHNLAVRVSNFDIINGDVDDSAAPGPFSAESGERRRD
jgi:hypothetical protein